MVSHADVAQAARTLRDGPRVDVVLVDHAVDEAGPHTLIALANASAHDVSTIVMLADATAKSAAAALDSGAAAVIDKPFSIEELHDAIDRATRAGFRGNLEGISLVDMLQVFHISRRSVVLSIGGDPPTRIVFEAGEIVHAERGELSGEAVLHDMLEARNGSIHTLPPPEDGPVTIERPFQSLLLNVLRQRDETLRSGPQDPVTDEELANALAGAEPIEDAEAETEPGGASEPGETEAPDPADPPVPAPKDEPAEAARTSLPARPWDPICAAVNAEIPGAVATALIDLEVGNLIGLHNQASFTPDFERFVALYTQSLFRGPEVRHIERTMAAQQGMGDRSAPYLEEIVLSSRHTHHLTKTIKDGRIAVMVVVGRRADVEATWRTLRKLVRGLESNLP